MKLTQAALAKKADFSQAGYSHVENGSSGASMDFLEKIAEALGVEANELIEEA